MWMEPDNYERATSRIYARKYPFPLSFILPRRDRAMVRARLEAYRMQDKDKVRSWFLQLLFLFLFFCFFKMLWMLLRGCEDAAEPGLGDLSHRFMMRPRRYTKPCHVRLVTNNTFSAIVPPLWMRMHMGFWLHNWCLMCHRANYTTSSANTPTLVRGTLVPRFLYSFCRSVFFFCSRLLFRFSLIVTTSLMRFTFVLRYSGVFEPNHAKLFRRRASLHQPRAGPPLFSRTRR